ncbi:MAG: hypothetical protein FJ125_04060, partial [Deltaproteobacteria bacterium]|nr:hypothetical protein [Deltaproteobacteria bacterium]
SEYKDVIGANTMGAPTILMTEDLAQTERIHRQFELLAGLSSAERQALAVARRSEAVKIARLAPLLSQYPLEKLQLMVERLREPFSLFTFIPQRQEEKLSIIADIRTRLQRKRASFDPEDREKLDKLMKFLNPELITPENLPEWVRVQFREPNTGQEGRFVILRTVGSKSDILDTKALKQAFFTVMDEGREVRAGAIYFVLPEIMETIEAEGPVVIGTALGGLVIILLVFFRSPTAVLLVMLPLCFSVLWTMGCLALLQLKLNFFNIVVIPLLLGMGIDNGVHIYQRFREEASSSLGRVLRETGGALLMATLTTMIGFSGMFFADHRGLNSMATLADIGMGLSFLGAVVTLPALLHLGRVARQTRARRVAADRPGAG